MIIPFLVITFLITHNIYSGVKSEAEKENGQIAEKNEYVLNNIFESVMSYYNQFTTDSKFLYLLSADKDKTSLLFYSEAVTEFHNRASGAVTSGKMFDSIYLYSKKSSYVHAVDSSNSLDRFLFLDWYKAYEKAGRQNTVCTSSVSGNDVMSIVMNIYYENDYAGALVFNISKNYLDDAINKSAQDGFNYCSFLTSNNDTVYSSGGLTLDEAKEKACFSKAFDFSGQPLSYSGFLICNLPLLTLRRMLPIALPYFLLTVFAIVFVAFMCSLKFYKSIANIITAFENAALGTDAENNDYNELHYINDNIVNMLLHSEQVENDLVMRFSELKKAQSIALQTQMNPHFLFNTLNLINTIIIEDCGRDTDAVMVVKKLAELLNLSLDTKTYIVSVEAELDYAKKYVDIELVRNDYNFIVDWDIDPGVMEKNTLKMILQPILENAVFHGINNIDDSKIGNIHVRAYSENDTLVFSVKDNGKGIDKDTLASITEKLVSDEIVETKHIGIANVNSRIQLVYGKEYGINIETSENGTEIIIRQPL